MLFPPYIHPPPLPDTLSLCSAPLLRELVLYLQCIGELVYEKWLITAAVIGSFFFSFFFPLKKKQQAPWRGYNKFLRCLLARGVCMRFFFFKHTRPRQDSR